VVSLIVIVLTLVICGYGADILSASVLPGEVLIILLVSATIIYMAYVLIFYYIGNKQFNKGVNVD
ncbi:MAG: hypothetical protein J6Q38_05225, partial [Clostridia bacterium]|nr:hypothetical protein [Clostridia bacterium]